MGTLAAIKPAVNTFNFKCAVQIISFMFFEVFFLCIVFCNCLLQVLIKKLTINGMRMRIEVEMGMGQ